MPWPNSHVFGPLFLRELLPSLNVSFINNDHSSVSKPNLTCLCFFLVLPNGLTNLFQLIGGHLAGAERSFPPFLSLAATQHSLLMVM